MFSILGFGFLIGLRHALEPDHVMAVATLSADKNTASAIRQGLIWGIGHTLTLFVVGGMVIFADSQIPNHVADSLELVVGFMLVILGGDLLRRMIRDRWHIHTHWHVDGSRHVHLHSHAESGNHNAARHHHTHPRGVPLRALLVGMMHGLAGSAALVLLALQAVQSPLTGVFYILLFGLGSIAGMALLSVCIAIPLNRSRFKSGFLRNSMSCAIGICTISLGLFIIYDIGVVNALLIS